MAKAPAPKAPKGLPNPQSNPLILGSKAQRALPGQSKTKALSPKAAAKITKIEKGYNANTKTAAKLGESILGQPKVSTGGIADIGGGLKVLGRLVSEAKDLPKNTAEGLVQLGGAGLHDAEHPFRQSGLLGDLNIGGDIGLPGAGQTGSLGKLSKATIQSDPVYKTVKSAVHGHVTGKYLAQNPLGTLMDVSMVAAPATAALDAARGASAIGDVAEGSSALQRFLHAPDRPIQSVEGSELRVSPGKYSRNPIIRQAQRAMDDNAGNRALGSTGPALRKMDQILHHPVKALTETTDAKASKLNDIIRNRVNENQHIETMLRAEDEAKVLKGMSRGLGDHLKSVTGRAPEASLERDLVPHLRTGVPTSGADLHAALQSRLSDLEDSLAAHHSGAAPLTHAARESLGHNIDVVRHAVNHMSEDDLDRVVQTAHAHSALQNAQDLHLSERSLRSPEQMRRRAITPYAQENMGAVRAEDLPKNERPVRAGASEYKDASDAAADAEKAARDLASGKHPDLKELRRNVSTAERRIDVNTDREKLPALRAARNHAQAALKQRQQELLPAARQNARDLRTQAKALRPQGGTTINKGWLTRDENGKLEPLEIQKVEQHMRENGVNPESVSYVNMRPPQSEGFEDRSAPAANSARRGGSKTPSYGGQGYLRGTADLTHEAQGRSLLNSVRRVSQARGWDRNVRDLGIKDQRTGDYFDNADVHGIDNAIHYYKQQHGLDLVKVRAHPHNIDADEEAGVVQHQAADHIVSPDDHTPGKDIVLMPRSAMDQMEGFDQASGRAGNVARNINTAFRGAVLPFSANYFQSIVQEGMFRGAVARVNPLRARMASRVLDELQKRAGDETLSQSERMGYRDAYEHLHALSGSGLQLGLQDRMLQHELAKAHPDASVVARAARGAQAVGKVTKITLVGAHKIENMQARAVMGDFLQQMKNASGDMESVYKKLGAGDNAANERALVSRRINDVLGKYNSYSPKEQAFIRDYAPFWPWLQNATKFVTITMSRDHPFLQGFLNNVGQANAKAWNQQHAGAASLSTSFLGTLYGPSQTSMNTPLGEMDVLRNTPYGVAEESPVQGLSTIMPVESSAILGLAGDNSFGDPLKAASGAYGSHMQPGSWGATKNAAQLVGEDLIPYNIGKKIVTAASGHTSKSANLSKSKGLRIIENVLGGSLIPHNYGIYNKSSSSSSSGSLGGGSLGGGSLGGGSLGGGSL